MQQPVFGLLEIGFFNWPFVALLQVAFRLLGQHRAWIVKHCFGVTWGKIACLFEGTEIMRPELYNSLHEVETLLPASNYKRTISFILSVLLFFHLLSSPILYWITKDPDCPCSRNLLVPDLPLLTVATLIMLYLSVLENLVPFIF